MKITYSQQITINLGELISCTPQTITSRVKKIIGCGYEPVAEAARLAHHQIIADASATDRLIKASSGASEHYAEVWALCANKSLRIVALAFNSRLRGCKLEDDEFFEPAMLQDYVKHVKQVDPVTIPFEGDEAQPACCTAEAKAQ